MNELSERMFKSRKAMRWLRTNAPEQITAFRHLTRHQQNALIKSFYYAVDDIIIYLKTLQSLDNEIRIKEKAN